MGQRLNQYRLSQSADFGGIVQVAAYRAAVDVLNEVSSTPNHVNRASLAGRIVEQAHLFAPQVVTRFTWLAATNPTILSSAFPEGLGLTPENIVDNDIDFVVAGFFDEIANSFAEATP